jgi:hypothetical protein
MSPYDVGRLIMTYFPREMPGPWQPSDVWPAMLAIAWGESSFNPTACNWAGECSVGLFQIYWAAHCQYDLNLLFDPDYNTRAARDIFWGAVQRGGNPYREWGAYDCARRGDAQCPNWYGFYLPTARQIIAELEAQQQDTDGRGCFIGPCSPEGVQACSPTVPEEWWTCFAGCWVVGGRCAEGSACHQMGDGVTCEAAPPGVAAAPVAAAILTAALAGGAVAFLRAQPAPLRARPAAPGVTIGRRPAARSAPAPPGSPLRRGTPSIGLRRR